jgi:probable HAF family extracellular repeat protein
MVGLGDFPGGPFLSSAEDVSADGSVVVGIGQREEGVRNWVAYRWTEVTGMVALGSLPGGDFECQSFATAVSADGSVVVGFASSDNSPYRFDGEAFRWTESTGMVALGDLPGGEFQSAAYGVSADGSVIVGQGFSDAGGHEAFIWNAVDGMQSLQDVLSDAGIDMTGWQLYSALDVSADGTAIVGRGHDPDGNLVPWRAVVPEPSTLALLGMGALGLLTYCLRKK